MKSSVFSCALLLLFYLGGAHAHQAAETGGSTSVRDSAVVDHLLELEIGRERLSSHLAPIKSREELAAFMAAPGIDHPLKRLTADAQKRFLASITFNEHGVSSYRHADLLAQLSASEIAQVLSLIGAFDSGVSYLTRAKSISSIDREVIALGHAKRYCYDLSIQGCGDIEHAKCVSPGTCQMHQIGFICRSTC